MGGSRDPRRTIDVEADIVVRADDRLARMKSHPDADRPDVRGPGLGREGALRVGCGRDRRDGTLEDDEECVSLGRDLDPTGLLDRCAQDGVVTFEEGAECRAQGGREAGGSLDVREQERHGPDGEESRARPGSLVRHAGSIRRGRRGIHVRRGLKAPVRPGSDRFAGGAGG